VEPRAVSPPRAIGTPSRHHLKCGRMDIVFIDSTSWAAYDPDTPFERPLGGTQSAVCYLAPELAKLGHRVTLASRAAEPKLELSTYFGWRVAVVEGTKTTTLQNFPAQAHGAEMLRLACNWIVEDGIELCCPIHDAVLVEAGVSEIDAVVARTREHMADAGRAVLGGFEVKTDAEIIRFPDRYMDPRGVEMWQLMMELKTSGVPRVPEPTPPTQGPTQPT
jgi:hypothetical protein